jgi:uncharacterized phage-associated protein
MSNFEYPIQFPSDREKALDVAKYFLKRLGGSDNYFRLLKLIFFADRYHFRKYLRLITNDHYVAMKRGPVASYLYDVFKGKVVVGGIENDGYRVKLTEAFKPSRLSQSDIEAIDFSLSNFSKYGERQLWEITHAYPEWAEYEDLLLTDSKKSERMYLEMFLKNAKKNNKFFKKHSIVDPFQPIEEEDQKELVEYIRETCAQIV